MAAELSDRFSELKCRLGPVRQQRNRVIAHGDLKTGLEPEKELMPGLVLDEVDGAIRSIHAMLNLVEGHFRDSATMSEEDRLALDVRNLVPLLEAARRSEEEEERL